MVTDAEILGMFDEQGMTYQQIADKLNCTYDKVKNAIYRERKRRKGKIEYPDRKIYTDEDLANYATRMQELQRAAEAINTRQVKATIHINDDKPIGIVYWGDWHIGAIGTDYTLFEEDLHKVRDTDGLYFIGAGDYIDNYITGTPKGGNFEALIPPAMQDQVVQYYMRQVNEKCLALVKGCHDAWLKKQADQDLMEKLCEITNSVNLWHGGELTTIVGGQPYLWRCRHRYKYQSSLNLANAMRRINEIQGPCDIAAEAHLHNAFVHERHMMGDYRLMLRTGSYKVWDEYGQQLAGYKGKPSVPMVILYPGKRKMLYHRDGLRAGLEILKAVRK